MHSIRFETVSQAEETLQEYGVSDWMITRGLDVVGDASTELLIEYSLEEVDATTVRRLLQIGFAELLVEFMEEDVLPEGDQAVEELLDDFEQNPVSNARFVAGRVATRDQATATVSSAIVSRGE